jgi:DUF4097 and DUF4098 domain-containing protein YvlB
MHRRAFLAGSGLLATAVAGCIGDLETAAETVSLEALTADATLRVTNRNGDVTVRTDARADGELSVTKRTRRGVDLSRVSVSVDAADGLVTVTPDIPDDVDPGHVSLDLAFAAPEGAGIDHVETRNGRVLVEGGTGDATAASRNGGVTVRDLEGYVTLATSNGDVETSDCAGVDGLATSNGSITAEILAIRRDVVVETSNGAIEADLSPDLDADLVATVSNGSIETTDLDLTDATVTDSRVEGTLGAGGTRLALHTTNGSIDVAPRET